MDLFYASNAILAKARAMYGNRLTRKNYADLLQCRTVADVAAYLKMHTNYKDVLASLNENDIHRGQLEIVLRKKIFRDFEKLARYELSIGEEIEAKIVGVDPQEKKISLSIKQILIAEDKKDADVAEEASEEVSE